jgi:hypothetical protein
MLLVPNQNQPPHQVALVEHNQQVYHKLAHHKITAGIFLYQSATNARAAQAAPAPVAPVQAQPADNRWDLPIQERVKMQQDGQQVVAAQAPQPISPVGMPGQPGGGIPVNQIVDKMDQVLAGGGQAQGQPSDDRWDVPIQERIKQGQASDGARTSPPKSILAGKQLPHRTSSDAGFWLG